MIKRKCSDLLQNKYLPFIFLAVLILILHIFVQYKRDDLTFQRLLSETEYFNLLKERYFLWTSRFIIESVLLLIVRCPIIVFKLLNVLFVLLLTASLTRLVSSNMDTKISWTVVLLFLIYPFIDMSSAGWAATSINYLWPAATGAFSLIPFIKVIRGEKIRGFEYPFYIVALIFAANQEQIAALLLGFGLVFTIYIAIRDKGISKFLIICNAIALGGLILVMLCPGNSNRAVSESETWFPEHSSMSVGFKLFLGISNTLNYLFNQANTFIFLLALILLVIIIKKKVGKIPTALATSTVIFCFFNQFSPRLLDSHIFTAFNEFLSRLNLGQNPYSGMVNLFPILVCSAVLGIIFLEIYLVYGKSNKSGLLLIILCAGLAASFILGFSPTVYASGFRIFLFLNLTLIAAITLIVKFEWNSFSHLPKRVFYTILILYSAYIYIDTVIKLYTV